AVRGEDEIEIERTVPELDEVLAPLDLRCLRVLQHEAELAERRDQGASVRDGFLDEDVGVLGGVREAVEDRARLADEQIPDAVAREGVADLLCLGVVKSRGHIPATRGGSPRTTAGTRPSFRRSGTARRRGPACRS